MFDLGRGQLHQPGMQLMHLLAALYLAIDNTRGTGFNCNIANIIYNTTTDSTTMHMITLQHQ